MNEEHEAEPHLEGAPTLGKPPTSEQATETPAFPIPGWDRYQSVRFLGQGGMGQVFLAYDPRLRRHAALKFVHGGDARLTQRLLFEARAQARVEHERVCQVYEVGEVQGRPFIAMQYVDGQPLHQLAGQLTVEQTVLVIREIAEGVHAAHQAGLIHRDLKPGNILVERASDGRLKPYVMDFGLARDWREQGATATGSVLGTPHYMAPEQARGEVTRLDRRADVYSLGATLYHLLTNQPPIPGDNALEVLNHIATFEPRPPRALNPDIPVDLEAITFKCLEKDRSARYDSARALAEDLDRFLRGEPVRARPTRLGYRLRKRLRKHRLVVSVSTVALLAVVFALGWAGLTRQEAVQRERLARRFTERLERIESLARYSGLSQLHDIRADRQALRVRMRELEAEIHEAGALAVGPGHYALGRGALALGDEALAREHLETAWRNGFREPRVAWSLALVMGHLYQDQLQETERLRNPEQRESRRRDLQRQYRDPALELLSQSQGADVPSSEYVAALLAFHEDRLDDALARLEAMKDSLPWFYEAPLLQGDILLARATRHWNQGHREEALADFEAGRRAYTAAAATGESVPEVHRALARLEYTAMEMELYGQGDVMPAFTRGQEALARALQADPDFALARVLEARFYNRLAEYRMSRGSDVEEILGKALSAARTAMRQVPEPPRARMEQVHSLWRRARALQARGLDPNEPLRLAVELLESIPPKDQDYEFHVNRGLVFKIWADYEDEKGEDSLPHRGEAIASYREATLLDERLPDAWINLGIAYLSRATHLLAASPLEDLQQAQAALDTSRKLNPRNYVPYFLGGTLHLELARRHRNQGEDARPDLATALEFFEGGIRINARIPQLHNGRSAALIEQAREAWDHGGDPFPWLAQARQAALQAIEVAPQQGFGQNNVGEAHAERATYRDLSGEDPGPDLQAAAVAYQQASELLSGGAHFPANLARVHARRAAFELEHEQDPRRSLERAEAALRQAFERGTKEPQAWLTQGEVQGLRARWRAHQRRARAEDFEEAARSFEKALELEPRRLDYRVAFGHFCREWASWRREAGLDPLPALRRGLTLANEALAARPDWADALLLRASLRERSGSTGLDPEEQHEAQTDLERALALNPHLTGWWKRRFPSRATASP
ncbi:protein kinase [Cystobacter fuscus]|uniref:Protein kinase n=1 Tax=Cystobacter fuscus TaxID=43 RepID=A0A250J1F1_9BACT|nr:serine/threonine-protein kinase [Cystobacter fuscus]ATB37221.1 protein kinase [Cystobacter fuscus]